MSFLSPLLFGRLGRFPFLNVRCWRFLAACFLLGAELASQGQIRINEILAGNVDTNGLRDEAGQLQDWIELHNTGVTPVDLTGWSLTDNLSVTGKWIFPGVTIGGGQFLVVFASGNDRRNPAAALHTNFRLSRGGEYLGLYNAAQAVVSETAPRYPEQRNGYSYGWQSAGAFAYYQNPTPGAANGTTTITEAVAPVHFSVKGGVYNAPFNLILTTTTPGATIRYTTDASPPTATHGSIFSAPVRLTAGVVVRAAAFKSNALPSPVDSHLYIFNASVALESLPILSVVIDWDDLDGPTGILGIQGGVWVPVDGTFDSWEPRRSTDYFNPAKTGIAWERQATIQLLPWRNQEGFNELAGIRVHGSESSRLTYHRDSKIPYNVFFRGDYGSGRLQHPLIPGSSVNSFDSLVLRAGHNDAWNPFLTDELVRRLFADAGHVSALGSFAHFYLNGYYQGYYNITERVEEDWLQTRYGGTNEWDVMGPYNEAKEGDAIAWQSMLDYAVSHNLSGVTAYKEMENRLDMENFVDYLLVNIYADTLDWTENNWRAARERVAEGKYRFFVWDAEFAMGLFESDPAHNNITEPNELGNSSAISTLYQRLRANADFKMLFADRAQKHFFNNGALSPTNVLSRFRSLRQQLLPSIPNFNNYTETNWVPARFAHVWSHLTAADLVSTVAAPTFSQLGGTVQSGFALSMSAPAGTIYYTTTGVDPRAKYGGGVAAGARTYSGPVTLNQSTIIKARVLSGGKWSALTEAEFQVAEIGVQLRFTELMYNPPGGDAYEFLEIKNIGTTPVELEGMVIDGADFTFDAGQSIDAGSTIILTSDVNPAAFASRYGSLFVFARFHGKLSNGGERLSLRSSSGNILTSVDYRDSYPWPPEADGTGRSLEVIDPAGDPNDPANWRASAANYGSPSNVPATPVPVVRLNEIMAENVAAVPNAGTYPDWIELYNSGGSAVSLAGWSLSDDGNTVKYIFPTGTSIPGLGYLTIWCDSDLTLPGLHAGFALDRGGQTVSLYNASGARVDAVTFGLQVADYTVGRISGAWKLNVPTRNAANMAATVSPATSLSLNEWLANSAAGFDDWIELFNRDPVYPVSLQGLYFTAGSKVHLMQNLSFLGPNQVIQLWADDRSGATHLEFRLPAEGATLGLYNENGVPVDTVTYTAMAEGISGGRSPDGNPNIILWPMPTPGLPNTQPPYTGAVLNEVLVRNRTGATDSRGRRAAYVELFNSGGSAFDLSGMRLSTDLSKPNQWTFPTGASVGPNGHRLIWFDSTRFPSATNETDLNTGGRLNGNGGGVYLFSRTGLLVDKVQFGFQIVDRTIGRTAGAWQLLNNPTPAAANSGAATRGSANSLRINEWMPSTTGAADWIEIYNSEARPVALTDIALTDDPSIYGLTKFKFGPLSFIDNQSWVLCRADGEPERGPDHLGFRLDGGGETLRLYNTSGSMVDSVDFGLLAPGKSQGRYGDGQGFIVAMHPTPGERNSYDSDNDGMPDTWEASYGLGTGNPNDAGVDGDGDGFTHLNEYRAGTHPFQLSSSLRIPAVSQTHGEVLIRVDVAPYRAYRVLSSPALLNGTWTDIGHIEPGPDSTSVGLQHHVVPGEPFRIYRLVLDAYP